jgi:hypothetical protein
MRKLATILIAGLLIAAGVVVGRLPASAHLGHTITVNDASAGEGGTATFTLTLAPAPETGETVSVKVATANGSALGVTSCPGGSGSPSSDYALVPTTTLTWTAGQATKDQPVTSCQDASGEGNETFFLNLSDATTTCAAPCTASTVSISRFQGVGTINDDEDVPALQIGDRTQAEGPLGTTTFSFPVTLSSPTNKTVTVNAATRNGTAGSSDYTSRNVTVTFPANTTAAQNIDVSVVGDTSSEPDETFFVDLTQPSNAKIGDPQGVGIIQNDDAPASGANTLVITDVTRNEGNTGGAPATPFTFTVTLGRAPGAGHTATVNYHAAEGSASSGADYVFVSGTLVFGTNETAKTVTVPVIGDTTPESNETFSVILSGADCSTSTTPCEAPSIADAEGKGTINNDDAGGETPSPSPSPSPGGTITPRLKVGGYFQARVTAASPCQAGRLIKVKKVVSGTDKVMVDGLTNADGVYKEAVRPKKSGRFYAQVYTFTKNGVTCKGGKSPVRTLPA